MNRFAERFAEQGLHPFRKKALQMNVDWMIERFEGSDGLGAIFPAMLYSVIALKAHGFSEEHPVLKGAIEQLKGLEHQEKNSLRIEPCFSPVWDTAIVAMATADTPLAYALDLLAADFPDAEIDQEFEYDAATWGKWARVYATTADGLQLAYWVVDAATSDDVIVVAQQTSAYGEEFNTGIAELIRTMPSVEILIFSGDVPPGG